MIIIIEVHQVICGLGKTQASSFGMACKTCHACIAGSGTCYIVEGEKAGAHSLHLHTYQVGSWMEVKTILRPASAVKKLIRR